jgi:phage terminase large subunit
VDLRFEPREYQLPFLRAMGSGSKRAVLVWHRRAGKDITTWNWTIGEALRKTGTYFYFFPTYAQGKKILWDGIDGNGIRFLDYIPDRDLCKFNETEMQVSLPPIQGGSDGSIIQIVGTDKMDYIVGTNPIGCVFSEYAIQSPKAWQYVEPILLENQGWAVFCYTPRGSNHGKRLFNMARSNPKWYCSRMTIGDTKRPTGKPVITEEQIEDIRAEGEDEDLIQQEYYCSFSGAQQGSYYSRLVKQAEEEQRIRLIQYEPSIPVDTIWDIGHGDSTAIGFRQLVWDEVRWIDYYESSGEGLPHYASVIAEKARQNNWRYGVHIFPHDMKVHDFSTGQTRLEAARKLGLTPARVSPKLGLDEGIDAVRRRFSKYWFHQDNCKKLLDALVNYRKKWDETNHCYQARPVHDWTSHPADMVRYEAVSTRDLPTREEAVAKMVQSGFDPLNEDVEARSYFDTLAVGG